MQIISFDFLRYEHSGQLLLVCCFLKWVKSTCGFEVSRDCLFSILYKNRPFPRQSTRSKCSQKDIQVSQISGGSREVLLCHVFLDFFSLYVAMAPGNKLKKKKKKGFLQCMTESTDLWHPSSHSPAEESSVPPYSTWRLTPELAVSALQTLHHVGLTFQNFPLVGIWCLRQTDPTW